MYIFILCFLFANIIKHHNNSFHPSKKKKVLNKEIYQTLVLFKNIHIQKLWFRILMLLFIHIIGMQSSMIPLFLRLININDGCLCFKTVIL